MEKVLVTGGAGYVGSLLVPELMRSGYHVRVFDRMLFNPYVFDHLVSEEHLEVIKGDLRDAYRVESALQSVDSVIHLGCLSNDPSCSINEELTRSINYDAGVQLIQLAKKNGVRRFLNASSASVYGLKEEQEVTETLSLEPITSYAKYKAELEIVLQSELSSSFGGVSVRPATLCGCALRQRLDLTVNTLTYEAICKGKITLFNALQERPNLTVQDMVAAYLLLMKAPIEKIHGEVFNVTAENYKVVEIAHIVKETLDAPIEIEIIETNDRRSYRLSGEKFKHILGYTPKLNIRHAITELSQALQSGQLKNPMSSIYRNMQFLQDKPDIWTKEPNK